jgi:hypothetical protein
MSANRRDNFPDPPFFNDAIALSVSAIFAGYAESLCGCTA